MIYVKEIENAIDELGLVNAQVCVHSSMKSFGDNLEDGIPGLIRSFIRKGCTLMVPAFSYEYARNPVKEYMPLRNGINYEEGYVSTENKNLIYNTASKSISVEHMGVFPKYVLEEPDCRRGNHPINSFAAVGTNAERLIAGQTPQNVYAPFRQLYEDNGFVLLMGVGLERATMIHYAEQTAGRKLFIRWANDQNGRVIPIPGGGCSSGFNRLRSVLKAEGQISVGKSLWQCYKARDILDLCSKAIAETPEITRCDNPDCILCRDAIAGGPIMS